MKIQERESDLVLGTFGRSVYILDNIAPLRAIVQKGEEQWKKDSLILFDIPDAYMYESEQPIALNFSANAVFSGANKGRGAQLYVYYNAGDKKEKTKGKMYVMNETGDTIRTRKIEVKDGVNHLGWGLDTRRNRPANQPLPKDKDKEYGGRPVLPGTYTVCQNVTFYLDAAGNATVNATDLDGGSTDNCGASNAICISSPGHFFFS